MKMFGWLAGREGSRPALSRGGSVATSGEWPRSYEAQVRAGYLGNAVAQRAVKVVAEHVGGAPLVVSDPALAALMAARVQGVALLEAVAAQMLLHGNAFVQVLRDPQGAAAGLFPLRPERVSVEADARGWPAAYRYAVGGQVTRLSGLHRARRGTVGAVLAAGARFVLIEDAAAVTLALSAAAPGMAVRVMASGVGDAAGPVETIAVLTGAAMVPPSPVHLTANALPDGGARLSWIRRSRSGWRWHDGSDAPLGEEAEAYRVTILSASGGSRTQTVMEPGIDVTPDERAAGPMTLSVQQIGSNGLSAPATRTL